MLSEKPNRNSIYRAVSQGETQRGNMEIVGRNTSWYFLELLAGFPGGFPTRPSHQQARTLPEAGREPGVTSLS